MQLHHWSNRGNLGIVLSHRWRWLTPFPEEYRVQFSCYLGVQSGFLCYIVQYVVRRIKPGDESLQGLSRLELQGLAPDT